MKNYKDFPKKRIGCSDIASLIFVYFDEKDGLTTKAVGTGFDGCYEGYIIEGEANIGSHYDLILESQSWLKIYDDDELTLKVYSERILAYKAGGTFIIQSL